MRGKPGAGDGKGAVARITPAHAGKTIFLFRAEDSFADHPRACGENCTVQDIVITAGGSPPRMRGKPSDLKVDIDTYRITPAHAGKT